MSHDYKKAAKESHEKKLKSYGEGAKGKAKNWAGFDALNTNEQAGRAPLNTDKYVAPEISNQRTERKKGGRVHGADSLKRLDKSPRKSMARPVLSGTDQQEKYDPQTKFDAGKMNPTATRKEGGRIHDDEKEDRALVKKMVKGDALTGKSYGGRTKRGGGGELPPPEEAMRSAERLKEIKAEPKREPEFPKKLPPASEAAKTSGRTQPYKKGGRTKRADGGPVAYNAKGSNILRETHENSPGDRPGKKDGGAFSDYMDDDHPRHVKGGKKSAGQTIIKINIGGPKSPEDSLPMMAAGLPPMAPPPPPPAMMPPQMPPGPPPGAMPPGPPPGPPPGMMGRKDGGKVQVPYKKPGRKGEYPAMDFGAGGGFGRKQKADAYGSKG